ESLPRGERMNEVDRVAVVVEELQALDEQIQKLLSRRRYLRGLKARLLDKPSSPSVVGVTSTPRCAAQVNFTPAPRRSDTDDDLSVFQLCRREFKARTPPSAQASIATQNRFNPLRVPSSPSAPGDVIVLGDSIVRNLNITCPNRKSFVSCFPGARVRDVMRRAPAIYEKHKNRAVGAIVLHAGVNDIRHRQSEILTADFMALIKDTKERTPSAKIFISGPLPLVRRSNEYYSRLLGLNNWLQGFCKNQDIGYINNWDLFWERPRFFKRDGLHPNSFGARVLSENISKVIRLS
uniref:SGNH hydrolase-type esterase domain-containing protein n=1 Tax=Erpetoichthys calabaricus TaxID=27687 RepID=A0A8C4SYK5_ERPCA